MTLASVSRRGIWRTEVSLRVGELRGRLQVAQTLAEDRWAPGQSLEERQALAAAVDRCLANAAEAVGRDRQLWQELSSWWSGAAMTTGWESVHDAECNLLLLESKDDARTTLPWLLAWVQGVMDGGWRKKRHEEDLRAQIKAGKLDRTRARQALKDVIVANNSRYANLRAFRNNLVVVTALLATLAIVLSAWHLLNPSVVTLCTGEGAETTCLSGPEPRGPDVALVALFGALGGMLAIAFGLAKTKLPPSRFDPKAWLGLLKPVAGAATALIAVVAIQGGLVLGPGGGHSEMLLLAYAAIFGFSQQLLTRFVDKRAEALIDTDDADKPEPEPKA